jgi:hypothetical protein
MTETPSLNQNKLNKQAVLVIDKKLQLVTLWNLEKFDEKMNMLRETFNKFVEESEFMQDNSQNSNNSAQTEANGLITDSMDEWQTLEQFNSSESLSPRM